MNGESGAFTELYGFYEYHFGVIVISEGKIT
jgi:hypothetical protein